MRLPERPGREMPKVHRVCRTTLPPAPSDLERHAPSVAGKFRPPGRAPPRGLTQPPGSAREEVPPTPPGYGRPSSSHGAGSAINLVTHRLARGGRFVSVWLREPRARESRAVHRWGSRSPGDHIKTAYRLLGHLMAMPARLHSGVSRAPKGPFATCPTDM